MRDFPGALAGLLEKENVFFFDALYPLKPASAYDLQKVRRETLLKVHSQALVDRVGATGHYEGALYSVSGTLEAALRIASGEITNAFEFTGYGDHHAGKNFFGGGCYFNGAAVAVREIRERFNFRRFAVIDTDPHHGDGSWDLFQEDPDVLYLCFCSGPFQKSGSNLNIAIPRRTHDAEYFAIVQDALETHVHTFEPRIIFWNWGYDGTIGDYGDIGISPGLHPRLAAEIKKTALKTSEGRMIVVLCGGSRRDLATLLIPRLIKVLSDPPTPRS